MKTGRTRPRGNADGVSRATTAGRGAVRFAAALLFAAAAFLTAPAIAQDDAPLANASAVGGSGQAPGTAAAATAPATLDRADTAWMLVSSALVLMMTAPGLALFYGGLVRKRNILSVMMQCVFLTGLMSILWALIGYSLAFAGEGGFVGNLDHAFLRGLLPTAGYDSMPLRGGTRIPALLFMVYQGMFFIITPALICGAFAERMKFSALVPFLALWGLLIYCPIVHWVWQPGGWLFGGRWAVLDFAGGIVVHVSSGLSALVCAVMLKPRLAYLQEPMPPHNLTYTAAGTAMLWVGWFGFNAGSAIASNGLAVNAFVATHLGGAAGVLAWSAAEWVVLKRPTILGACSGAIAGLAGVTPAAGYVNPIWGIVIGGVVSFVCYVACTKVKNAFRYDDSLDAFGVHGVGGVVGSLLTGVFATTAVNSTGSGWVDGNPGLVLNQLVGIAAVAAYSAIGTAVLFKLVDLAIGARVRKEEELRGLDLTQHGEEGYIFY